MKKYLLTALAVSTLTFTSCSKDDGLTKEDFTEAMKDALKEDNTDDNTDGKIEDPALIGTWEANIFDRNGDAIMVKYIFNSDKTFEITNNDETKTGTFYVSNRYSAKNSIITISKNKGDSYNENSVSYEIVDGKLLVKSNHYHISIIELTKK